MCERRGSWGGVCGWVFGEACLCEGSELGNRTLAQEEKGKEMIKTMAKRSNECHEVITESKEVCDVQLMLLRLKKRGCC